MIWLYKHAEAQELIEKTDWSSLILTILTWHIMGELETTFYGDHEGV